MVELHSTKLKFSSPQIHHGFSIRPTERGISTTQPKLLRQISFLKLLLINFLNKNGSFFVLKFTQHFKLYQGSKA
jgi:hypothetical protein